MRWFQWMQAGASCAALAAGCADVAASDVPQTEPALSALTDVETHASAELRDAEGTSLGVVTFCRDGDATLVTIAAQLPAALAGLHGMHVHANDVPDNGEGCIADPNAPASTHFVSADGHYNPSGASHGHHRGDLPALLVNQDGAAWVQFRTDQFQPDELRGRALILHASSDNYANVPVGEDDDQYTPNTPAATELTAKTGNAGARLGCGVIE